MSYNSKLPMDDEFIAAGPADIRENLRALKEDKIVDAGTLAGLPAGNASGNVPVSNGTVNKNLNADLLDGYEANAFALGGHTHPVATASSNGLMGAVDKTKLNGIASGAQVNQSAFSNIAVNGTTIQADSETDTLSLTAGANISLTPDATNDSVTIAVSGTVPSATTATACSGNAATATKLATARTVSFTGDATGAASFDGSTNTSAALTLANSGVTAGTYRNVTVDAKGRVTAGTNPTTLAGYGITDALASSGTAVSANKLATARTIALTGAVTGSGSFDGSGNLTIATTATVVAHGTKFYSTPGTYNFVVPSSVVFVTLVGGGGGGAGGSDTGYGTSYDGVARNRFGGDGGKGGYKYNYIITGLTVGGIITVTVGSGGTGGFGDNHNGPGSSKNGTAGGSSSFGSYISVTGGGGGQQAYYGGTRGADGSPLDVMYDTSLSSYGMYGVSAYQASGTDGKPGCVLISW